MVGYALCARVMPEEETFLRTAEQVAEWWLAHVPEDRVAFWDFDAPDIPNTGRDTSGTAIAAAALLKLGELAQAPDARRRYRAAAEEIVRAPVAGCLTPVSADDRRPPGIRTQGCYNRRIDLATRHELIWGDYHLLEALQVLRGAISATAL